MNARAEIIDDHMVLFLIWLEGDFKHAPEVSREFVGQWFSTNPSRNVEVWG